MELTYWEKGEEKTLKGAALERFFVFTESLGFNYRASPSR